jgi:hypothetical protein
MRGKSRIYPTGEVPKGVGFDFAPRKKVGA